MEWSFLLVQALSGLASASSLFVIASGLTIVFGVTRIVNFAHGSFYMLGAYVAVTIVPWLLEFDRSPALFFLGVLASARRGGAARRGDGECCCCAASIRCRNCSSCWRPSASC